MPNVHFWLMRIALIQFVVDDNGSSGDHWHWARKTLQSLAMGIISQHAPSSGTGRKRFNMVDGEWGTD